MRDDVIGDGGCDDAACCSAPAVVRMWGAWRAIAAAWVVPQVLLAGVLPALGLVEAMVRRGCTFWCAGTTMAWAGLMVPATEDIAITSTAHARSGVPIHFRMNEN